MLEGVSYLLLLFIGMPLKYGFAIREVNQVLGMGHGILTMVFCAVLLAVYSQKKLSLVCCLGVFIASLIPFGAFVAERQLKKLSHA
eukprot:COSAG01_NODE_17336_length_1159_cov_1.182075_2_plen_86_part_00